MGDIFSTHDPFTQDNFCNPDQFMGDWCSGEQDFQKRFQKYFKNILKFMPSHSILVFLGFLFCYSGFHSATRDLPRIHPKALGRKFSEKKTHSYWSTMMQICFILEKWNLGSFYTDWIFLCWRLQEVQVGSTCIWYISDVIKKSCCPKWTFLSNEPVLAICRVLANIARYLASPRNQGYLSVYNSLLL